MAEKEGAFQRSASPLGPLLLPPFVPLKPARASCLCRPLQGGGRGVRESGRRPRRSRAQRRRQSKGEMDPRGGECARMLYRNWWLAPGQPQQKQQVLFIGSHIYLSISVQDEKLKALVKKMGTTDWKYITSYMPVSLIFHPNLKKKTPMLTSIDSCGSCVQTHTEHQCQHRWYKVLDPELIKGAWTKEEDEKVGDKCCLCSRCCTFA